MEKHVTLVAVLHIALGGVGLLAAGIVFFVVAGAGLVSGDLEAFWITSTVASFVALFLAVVSLPAIIAGLGLLRRRPWARVLTLVVAVVELFNIPLGTALGVYSLWVLLNRETERLFSPASAF